MGGCISTLCCSGSVDAGAAKAEDEQKLEITGAAAQNGGGPTAKTLSARGTGQLNQAFDPRPENAPPKEQDRLFNFTATHHFANSDFYTRI